ncbi:MAG: 6-carboxytetrahydropterin synthase QueD [Coriobacteriia bacterium]|nr:6-carboxytetrahydropterin synthase QueD [Coriobacteriia bacterium]
MAEYILYTDGGSRGNPGPAGIGFVLNHGFVKSCDGGAPIGEATNNVAEYKALIWGLENALALNITHLEARADSELLVKQLKGEYKVKNAALKPLFLDALSLSKQFEFCEFVHIPREENEEADALANEAMDALMEVGSPIQPCQAPGSLFDFEEDEEAEEQDSFGEEIQDYEYSQDEVQDSEAEDTFLGAVAPFINPAPEAAILNIVETEEAQLPVSAGIYTLTVKDHFDAAHLLYDYPGECRNLHGHTWDIEVSVESSQLCELGMVYDFALLKKDLKSVLNRYDHKYLNEIEPFNTVSPTAENLACIIFEELSGKIVQPGVIVTEVAVWESPIAKLTYKLR